MRAVLSDVPLVWYEMHNCTYIHEHCLIHKILMFVAPKMPNNVEASQSLIVWPDTSNIIYTSAYTILSINILFIHTDTNYSIKYRYKLFGTRGTVDTDTADTYT